LKNNDRIWLEGIDGKVILCAERMDCERKRDKSRRELIKQIKTKT